MKQTSTKILRHFEFLNNFKKTSPQAIYMIFGEEYYLREKVLATLLSAYSAGDDDDFDLITLYGDSEIGSEAIENLEMTPFLSKFKIVVIRDFHKMKTEEKNKLAEYAKDPSPQSILIAVAEKIDKRKKAEKTIFQTATNIECKKPYGAKDISIWLKNELYSCKKTMEADAIHLFSNSIDPDYMQASNELEKLIIYSKDATRLTKDDVLACVATTKTNKIFDLQNALGNKDIKQSMQIIENMMENNESAVFVIVMLTRFFTILWRIEVLRQRGLSDSEISNKHLHEVFYSFRTDYLSQAKNYRMVKLREIFELLLQADIDLKSIAIQEKIILDILTYKICN